MPDAAPVLFFGGGRVYVCLLTFFFWGVCVYACVRVRVRVRARTYTCVCVSV